MRANRVPLQRLGRRSFLKGSTLLLTAAALDTSSLLGSPQPGKQAAARPQVRFGLVTDLHYADKPSAGTRHYRETLGKLAEAAERFRGDQVDFVAELGDLIDAADAVDVEQRYLKTVNRAFAAIAAERHYVLGNHCVDTLTKAEFLGGVEQQQSYYAFDRGGIHFVVLDSCFRHDGQPYGRRNAHWTDANVPAEQLEWLQADLQATTAPTVVLAHQRLDVANHYGVKNAAAVRRVLQDSGNVRVAFQGHSHKNDFKEIDGIGYCTLVAMVEGTGAENSGYAQVEIDAQGTIRVQGFRNQSAYRWAAGKPTATR